MSFDAPYFYGSGLPASLSDETAVFDNVLSSNELLLECVENEIDVKIGVVAWGAFQNSQNSQHIGVPKVGIVSREGNELLEYDALILATGTRDFVPSFKGWELPGVLGGKAGVKLLVSYQCFNGSNCLVLGTTALALEFVRAARERGIDIAGFVEPTSHFQAGVEERAWAEANGIPVHYGSVIIEAQGTDRVVGAKVSNFSSGEETMVSCDTICVAIAALPNVELPSAMGCQMEFAEDIPAWVPVTDSNARTTISNVYWLSSTRQDDEQVSRVLLALDEEQRIAARSGTSRAQGSSASYISTWIEKLSSTGGSDVILCQCEAVTRGEFLDLAPPRYLKAGMKHTHEAVTGGDTGPRISQDLMKRMTRVGMGHCQGKRCRDEAAFLLAQRFGVPLKEIKPGSYRFPVRPVDMDLIAAEDDDFHTREKWPHWMHEEVVPENIAGTAKG